MWRRIRCCGAFSTFAVRRCRKFSLCSDYRLELRLMTLSSADLPSTRRCSTLNPRMRRSRTSSSTSSTGARLE